MSHGRAFSLTLTLACYFLSTGQNVAQDLHPALNNPDKFAWGLFVAINHPADLNAERGTPDKTKKLGDPGVTVWETWKLARTEVFLPNACKPLDWKAAPPAPLAVAALAPRFASQRASALQAKIFDPPKFSEDAARTVGTSVERTNLEPANLALARTFAPADPSPVVDAGELGNETRLNKEAFQFVVDKNLFSIEGQEDFLNKNLAVDFPVPATEVKAAWRMFTEVELDPAKTFRDLNNNGTIEDDERGLRLLERTYHVGYGVVRNQATGTSDLRPFGLVGLHIITKDIPNWFWTTFEHVDNPRANIDSLDRYSPPGQGYPPEVEGTIWRFYRLRGTQVDFVTSVGRPTILGNTQIEGTFQESSSCITCHARASIGRRLDNINAEGGRPLYPPGTHLPPSSEVSRPPTAPGTYPFGAARLSVFEDLRIARGFPALPITDPQNRGKVIAVLWGAVGTPSASLFVAGGTPGSTIRTARFCLVPPESLPFGSFAMSLTRQSDRDRQ